MWTWHDPCIPELSSSMNNSISSEIKKLSSKTRPPIPSRGLWWHYLVILITVSYCCLRTTLVENIILGLKSFRRHTIRLDTDKISTSLQFNKNIEQNSSIMEIFSVLLFPKKPLMYFSCLQSVSGWQLSKAFVYQHHAKFA